MFRALPTGAKLLILLTLALLPLGLAMVWTASRGLDEARLAHRAAADEGAHAAARSIDSLIARNALALRVAAAGSRSSTLDPCLLVEQSLSVAPGVARPVRFVDHDGRPRCARGLEGAAGLPAQPVAGAPQSAPLAAGAIRLALLPTGIAIDIGIEGGIASEVVGTDELRAAVLDAGGDIPGLTLSDGRQQLPVIALADGSAANHVSRIPIGNGRMTALVSSLIPPVSLLDRLELLLPILMWAVAALVSWWIVHLLLTGPLRRLEQAVSQYEPGESPFDLPERVGVAGEIRELGLSFARTIARIDAAEQEMAGALDVQRRLVREVHHRVKNNLQVVASLLSIHSRTAVTPEARAAYAGIMRRVDALSVVHRNHFAETEETRGIALRPLLSELAAGLRAGAPEDARTMTIDLDLARAHTTQDTAVAVAFLVTEMVEFTMLRCPGERVEITLRRSGDLMAELIVASRCLIGTDRSGGEENAALEDDDERRMFERIVDGLARQLRSPLDRRLGRYCVTIPVFPDH